MDLVTELARYGPEAQPGVLSLDEARAYCRRLAETHYENFTVASRLFPRHLHQHLCNVYAYCRWADDLADEAGDQSLALLDWWERQLDDLFADDVRRGSPDPAVSADRRSAGDPGDLRSGPCAGSGDSRTTLQHPVFMALAQTVRQFEIPREPLANLLVAFRRDQVQQRYESLADLMTYCEYSASPVGRIVLALGQSSDVENIALSDNICSGLQLANFCQDVRRDYDRGRIYLPLDLCRRFGWGEVKFAAGRCDDSFRQLLKELVDRADELLLAGRPLVRRASHELQLPIRVFLEGGRAILAAIRRARYDVWSRRPTVSRWTKLQLLASAWWQR